MSGSRDLSGSFQSILANWCQVEYNFNINKSKIRAKRKYNRICFPYFDDVFIIALWRAFNGFDFISLSHVAVCQTILVIDDVPHLTFYKSLSVRAVIVNNSLIFWMVTYRGSPDIRRRGMNWKIEDKYGIEFILIQLLKKESIFYKIRQSIESEMYPLAK